jgi:hypothetical protein
MKTSFSKLLANKSNALKSTGPKSPQGKRAASQNARTHGLSSVAINRNTASLDVDLVNDALGIGYSQEGAQSLAEALHTSRAVIAAKHAAYADKPVEARMPDMSMEKIDEAIGQLISPYARVTPRERRYMVALLHKEVGQDNDPVQRLGLKIEAHRKLMRYEQRAVNRLRGEAKGQK